ncbi:phosphocholine-specific phospholipase C [Amycolatopsis sp. Poz14]|uniref:phosphocholine-specific phospholipase C n=1 Tax=Amycolatopsis sp. Poz14 TaxID=1447705 RepID=UPI001EE7FBF0|nr:phospholipase C, phosphocholine-specific [Amycolatopsis sp. Poz14]MCG3752168.1 phospholipase C, phosphocholine-specific [Amycolatopsis sp. Poz14]
MAGTSRRNFLGMAGASLAGAAAGGLLPGSIGKALAVEPARRSGTIEDVEHVVVLMQENRSFDHYFGTMRGVRGYGDPRPHLLPNGRPVFYQPPAKTRTSRYNGRGLPDDAEYVLPFPLDALRTSEHIAGTDHSWGSGEPLWNGGRYDGWVNEKQDVFTMCYQQRSELPYHYALAEAFTICDAYHCSVPADTAPNRIMLWSGTIDTQNRLGTKANGPGLDERANTNGYTWTTYPERLQKAGVTWKLYQGGSGIPGEPTDNYTDNSLEFFAQYHPQEGASGPLVEQGVSTHTLKEFRADVQAGKLPQVTWIVPPYKYSEHAAASASDGAYYLNLVLDALVSNPEVWSKTVFFVNYDENDGLFDHVVPPMPPLLNQPGTDGLVSRALSASLADEFLDFDKLRPSTGTGPSGHRLAGKHPAGLGSRVPMFVVSPWSRGGWVCSETFDHTSVLRFLEARFGVAEPNISAWRRSVCGDLTSAFDFSRPQTKPVVTPTPAPLPSKNQPFSVKLPQAMPKQEPGVRPARALPYRFTTALAGKRDGHSVSVRFTNDGTVGAHFYVYAHGDSPRRYTVAAHDTLTDTWDGAPGTDEHGNYDLRVTGANGYLAQFTGTTADTTEPEVSVSTNNYGAPLLTLTVTNPGRQRRKLKLRNDYSRGAARTIVLGPGETRRVPCETASAFGWFDISLTDPAAPGYLRRFAGHNETGRPSFSDPGPRR